MFDSRLPHIAKFQGINYEIHYMTFDYETKDILELENNKELISQEEAIYELKLVLWKEADIKSIFIANKEDVKFLIDSEIPVMIECFYSYEQPLSWNDIKLISDNKEEIALVKNLKLQGLKNPMNFYVNCEYDDDTDEWEIGKYKLQASKINTDLDDMKAKQIIDIIRSYED